MEEVGPMGPPLLLAPDPPGVLFWSLENSALPVWDLTRLTAIQLPPAVMAPCMDLPTVRNLVYCKIVAILFPRKRPWAASRQFSRSNQQADFVCFPAKMTKFYFSRFHVAGAVGSFICDVTFRHQSHERSQLIFCCDMYTLGGCPSLIKDQTKHW